MIDWKPIEQLPEELKDGRQVLLWDDGIAAVGVWVARRINPGRYEGWASDLFRCEPIYHVTHYAEIGRPRRR